MNSKEYIKNVLVTEARDFTPVFERFNNIQILRLTHASAGMTSETTELLEAAEKALGADKIDRVNILEECGDVLWYVGIASDALNAVDEIAVDLTEYPRTLRFDDDLAAAVYNYSVQLAKMSGEFVDLLFKKHVLYGKPFNPQPLIEILAKVHHTVSMMLAETGYNVIEARERNIAKLKARYGEKFTEAAALSRDLEKERQILEQK